MSDRNPLDPAIEALLRSPAVWEELPSDVEHRIADEIAPPQARPRRLAWALGAGAAAAVAIVLALAVSGDDPDWTVAVVAAPESGIFGEVSGFNEPTGTRVVLEMHNLEVADPGTFYQVWWVDPEAGAVSSGSFLVPDKIEMRMGIRRSEFPKMLITIEASDGDPTRSDRVIAWSDD